ncbi:hypothetical protein [Terribacillus sp. DMT04]|uniref:hypothetical protein n=1 Tax=Terribacillus sp. DMT04 TaxID=2850441 RepID=UPI001C2CAA01|nr:hypothetical protein [Terribacillus sp. DMT04]QXE01736.1 hypothetical protein KS242_00145 [Terribacillus sp. DMT04]
MKTNKQKHIEELQMKALNGDEDALELYNEYVNRGEATAIHISTKNTSLNSQKLMSEAYNQNAEKRGDGLFDSMFSQEITKENIQKANPLIKIQYGMTERERLKKEHMEKVKQQQSKVGKESGTSQLKSKTFGELINNGK